MLLAIMLSAPSLALAQPVPQPFPVPPAAEPSPLDELARRRRSERPRQPVPAVERWSTVIGASTVLPPLVTDRHVFAHVPPATIAAFSIDDGVSAWSVELTPEQPFAHDDGRLFVAAGETIHAVNALNGAVVWRQPAGPLTAPPLAQGGWVVTAAAGEVVARRGGDGTVVWRQPHGQVRLEPTIDGDVMYVPMADARLLALQLTTGEKIWERTFRGAPSEVAALAGRVYVGSEDRYFYCLNAANGRTEWRHRIGAAVIGRPAVDADRVYAVAMDNQIHAYDRVNGAHRWQAALSFRPMAGPVLFGTVVTAPGASPELRSFDAVTGKPGRALQLGAELASPLVVRSSDAGPIAAAITGGLTEEWKLSVREASTAIPAAPLTVLPGKPVPVTWGEGVPDPTVPR